MDKSRTMARGAVGDGAHDPAITLEVCVDTIDGLHAAIAGGADRIELCAALETGGLTPSAGLLRAAGGPLPRAVPVHAMVRPRGGDFQYGAAELRLMASEIDAIAGAGLRGVVLGASQADGRLDHAALAPLVRQARLAGLSVTLHRAIDLCPDLAQATRSAIDLGFERILSSGGARSAVDGIAGLLQCFAAAEGKIAVMPGAGVDAATAALLRAALPLREIHASCSEVVAGSIDVDASAPGAAADSVAAAMLAFGFESGLRRRTSGDKVAALKAALKLPLPLPA